MKVLPFCAKCGREKETWLHDKRFSPKKHSLQATQDCREVYKLMKHEFEPCYSAKDVEEVVEKLELELARVREKVRENVRD